MNVEGTIGVAGASSSGPTRQTQPAASTGRPAAKPVGGKIALGVGVALAFALADTRAAPFVMAVLAAGIVYQVLNL